MDNLEFLISDEDEPQPKTKKMKSSKSSSKKLIKKSNFSQVKINIYEPEYQKWIIKCNSKINDHFQKVHFTIFNFFLFFKEN
jgi:hypothetical protein